MHATEAGNRVFPSRPIAAILAVLLAVQIALPRSERNLRASASWVNLASSLDDAKALSQVIIVGHVERIESADDIVVPARGEPGDVDRVGAEVVTIGIDRTYKGNAHGAIPLFHTKLETTGTAAPLSVAAAVPADRATPPPPTETETRRVLLDGDPSYQKGEQYVLFLTQGPVLRQNGVDVPTYAVIAPEGRYVLHAVGNDPANVHVHAMTSRGFAPAYDGGSASGLLAALTTPIAARARPSHRGRTTTALIVGALVVAGAGLAVSDDRHRTHGNGTGTTTAPEAGDAGAGPQDLSPGTSSYDPAVMPTLQSPVTLSWRALPASVASRYLVTVGKSDVAPRTIVTAETTQTVQLPDGTYGWSVRAIDASRRRGPPARMRYFRVSTPPQHAILR